MPPKKRTLRDFFSHPAPEPTARSKLPRADHVGLTTTEICPMCMVEIQGSPESIQRHVNRCLDASDRSERLKAMGRQRAPSRCMSTSQSDHTNCCSKAVPGSPAKDSGAPSDERGLDRPPSSREGKALHWTRVAPGSQSAAAVDIMSPEAVVSSSAGGRDAGRAKVGALRDSSGTNSRDGDEDCPRIAERSGNGNRGDESVILLDTIEQFPTGNNEEVYLEGGEAGQEFDLCGNTLSHRRDGVDTDASEMNPGSRQGGHPYATPRKRDIARNASPVPLTRDEVTSKPKTYWNRSGRPCPFYKWIPGTHITVDAFCFGTIPECQAYFLTHFHADHYGGLTKAWRHGPIFCSPVTAKLVIHVLRVDPSFVKPLPMEEEVQVTTGVTAYLMDANHCPGSAMILFTVVDESSQCKRHLHTGDFRADPSMLQHAQLQGPLDTLFLDTTYLNPQYSFPTQSRVLRTVADTAQVLNEAGRVLVLRRKGPKREPGARQRGPRITSFFSPVNAREMERRKQEVERERIVRDFAALTDAVGFDRSCKAGRLLFVVGTYLIGKERVVLELAKRMDCKVFCTWRKQGILACLGMPDLETRLTPNPREASVHVVSLQILNALQLPGYLEQYDDIFTHLVAFRPTGWTFRQVAIPPHLTMLELTKAYSDMKNERMCGLNPCGGLDSLSILTPSYTSPSVILFGVPYSEHSSYEELEAFVKGLKVQRIIPTVHAGQEKSRRYQKAILHRWQNGG